LRSIIPVKGVALLVPVFDLLTEASSPLFPDEVVFIWIKVVALPVPVFDLLTEASSPLFPVLVVSLACVVGVALLELLLFFWFFSFLSAHVSCLLPESAYTYNSNCDRTISVIKRDRERREVNEGIINIRPEVWWWVIDL
jgi:hypothetical protein